MVNFLNENNKRLATKLEQLKTIEERNVAFLAISFQLFKVVTEQENIIGTTDPVYLSMIKEMAYSLNELSIIDVELIAIYAKKFLELKFFRFDSKLDESNNVGELFGMDKILGESLVTIWNNNFELFKEVSDLYYISEIFDYNLKRLTNRNTSSEAVYAVEINGY